MAHRSGEIVYRIYRALTYGLSPLIRLHLQWRKLRGREHPLRWRERLGQPSAGRPAGHLVWFHAVSLGEGLAVIPVIKCCLERRPDVTILMTTTTSSALSYLWELDDQNYSLGPVLNGRFIVCMEIKKVVENEVIKHRLPNNVIYQFAPLDIPASVDAFLHFWRPDAVILVESELWPNLIMGAAKNGITLALLNGRMSTKSFQNWSQPVLLPLINLMLSKFSLILPLSTTQGIRLQLLQASPSIINFSGDLKYVTEEIEISAGDKKRLEELHEQLFCRKVWMASSIHKGEEEIFMRAHHKLKVKHPDIITVIVPRQPQHGRDIALKLQKEGVSVALRSHRDKLTRTNIFVIDSLGELRNLYRLTPIAVIGGSFLEGSTGHNILEAAAAGCAVLTGDHIGHFSHMVLQMQRINPLSVMQISDEKLVEAVSELFNDAGVLEARRAAAKQAYRTLSNGTIENIWIFLQSSIFKKLNRDVIYSSSI